ncbi:MAG: outer membrane beta-barrel protein [Candidatus Acidiferrales bacterium]
MKKLLLLAVVIFFAPDLFAQSNSSLQLSVDYSYFRFAESTYIPNFSLNGAGGSISYFFNKHIGVKADFQDYGSHSLNFAVPASSAPCSGLADCPISVSSNFFTYTAGPVVRFHVKKLQPFAEVMFGGAHDSSFAKIYNACYNQSGCVNLSKQPNNNAFAWILGGGLDIPFKEHVSIRPIQVDYVHTSFGDSLTNILPTTQKNFRYLGGVVIKF